MSKELEALKILKANAILFDDGTDFGASMLEAITVLDKALTPPTQEEVSKALSDYYGREVIFEENVFWYKSIIYDNELWIRDVSFKDLAKDNRGDLITLIGRFYQGVEHERV